MYRIELDGSGCAVVDMIKSHNNAWHTPVIQQDNLIRLEWGNECDSHFACPRVMAGRPVHELQTQYEVPSDPAEGANNTIINA